MRSACTTAQPSASTAASGLRRARPGAGCGHACRRTPVRPGAPAMRCPAGPRSRPAGPGRRAAAPVRASPTRSRRRTSLASAGLSGWIGPVHASSAAHSDGTPGPTPPSWSPLDRRLELGRRHQLAVERGVDRGLHRSTGDQIAPRSMSVRATLVTGISPILVRSRSERSARCTLAMRRRAPAVRGTVTCGSRLGRPRPHRAPALGNEATVPAGPPRQAARRSRLQLGGDPAHGDRRPAPPSSNAGWSPGCRSGGG